MFSPHLIFAKCLSDKEKLEVLLGSDKNITVGRSSVGILWALPSLIRERFPFGQLVRSAEFQSLGTRLVVSRDSLSADSSHYDWNRTCIHEIRW